MRPVPEWEALKARLEAQRRSQAQLDAIISRKLAKEREKLEAAQKAAEDARKLAEETEKRVNEAREKGISLGLLQAKRNAIAEQYGLSAELLPEDETRLDEFGKQHLGSLHHDDENPLFK